MLHIRIKVNYLTINHGHSHRFFNIYIYIFYFFLYCIVLYSGSERRFCDESVECGVRPVHFLKTKVSDAPDYNFSDQLSFSVENKGKKEQKSSFQVKKNPNEHVNIIEHSGNYSPKTVRDAFEVKVIIEQLTTINILFLCSPRH